MLARSRADPRPPRVPRTGLVLPRGASDERREEGYRVQLREREVEDEVGRAWLSEGRELSGGGLENRGLRAMDTYDEKVHYEIRYSP